MKSLALAGALALACFVSACASAPQPIAHCAPQPGQTLCPGGAAATAPTIVDRVRNAL